MSGISSKAGCLHREALFWENEEGLAHTKGSLNDFLPPLTALIQAYLAHPTPQTLADLDRFANNPKLVETINHMQYHCFLSMSIEEFLRRNSSMARVYLFISLYLESVLYQSHPGTPVKLTPYTLFNTDEKLFVCLKARSRCVCLESMLLEDNGTLVFPRDGVACDECLTLCAPMLCSKCQKSAYCSAACQKKAWSRHKLCCEKQPEWWEGRGGDSLPPPAELDVQALLTMMRKRRPVKSASQETKWRNAMFAANKKKDVETLSRLCVELSAEFKPLVAMLMVTFSQHDLVKNNLEPNGLAFTLNQMLVASSGVEVNSAALLLAQMSANNPTCKQALFSWNVCDHLIQALKRFKTSSPLIIRSLMQLTGNMSSLAEGAKRFLKLGLVEILLDVLDTVHVYSFLRKPIEEAQWFEALVCQTLENLSLEPENVALGLAGKSNKAIQAVLHRHHAVADKDFVKCCFLLFSATKTPLGDSNAPYQKLLDLGIENVKRNSTLVSKAIVLTQEHKPALLSKNFSRLFDLVLDVLPPCYASNAFFIQVTDAHAQAIEPRIKDVVRMLRAQSPGIEESQLHLLELLSQHVPLAQGMLRCGISTLLERLVNACTALDDSVMLRFTRIFDRLFDKNPNLDEFGVCIPGFIRLGVPLKGALLRLFLMILLKFGEPMYGANSRRFAKDWKLIMNMIVQYQSDVENHVEEDSAFPNYLLATEFLEHMAKSMVGDHVEYDIPLLKEMGAWGACEFYFDLFKKESMDGQRIEALANSMRTLTLKSFMLKFLAMGIIPVVKNHLKKFKGNKIGNVLADKSALEEVLATYESCCPCCGLPAVTHKHH